MENLKRKLNVTKAHIKELEEQLAQLVQTQESLESELTEASYYDNEEKKKLIPWFYNPDVIADYPTSSINDISPFSDWDEYEHYMGAISENLDFDSLTDYDVAFLFGHYMANHLLQKIYNNEWPEKVENMEETEEIKAFSKEYNTYFQMAITFLFGLKIMLENVVKNKDVLKGFQKSLDNFDAGFELLSSEDTTKFLTTIITNESPYTLTMKLDTPKEKEKEENGNQNPEMKKLVSSLEDSLEKLVKEKLGI